MTVVLHVGSAKTGTTYLQAILAEHRDVLREQGVLYPFVAPGAMFRGAVEVRGSAAKFGLEETEISGTWEQLCARARDHEVQGGTTVLSHEVLAGATPEQVARALAPLGGVPVRVVVTARDLGRQATAHWQEEVKLGATGSFAEFERDQLRADTGPDAGPDAGGRRPHFWHAQDFADTLGRWGHSLPPDGAELVVCPSPEASPDELWRRFAGVVGIDPASVPAPGPHANASLSAESTALLRAVNARLVGRLSTAEHRRLVKREWAEGVLARREGTPLRAPAALDGLLGSATDSWLDRVRGAGHPVHGDVADLRPRTGTPADPSPDVPVDADEDPDRIAAGFLRAAADARPRRRDRPRRRGRGPMIRP